MQNDYAIRTVFSAVDRMTAPMRAMRGGVSRFAGSIESRLRMVQARTDRVTRAIGRAGKYVALLGGAAVISGAAFLARTLSSVADSADQLAKESRRIQFPIEQLQEWRFVAEQSGVSNEALSNNIAIFVKRVGEADAGLGPLKSSLEKLNPELLKQIKGASGVEEAFSLVINEIGKLDSATERAALANAAFGRSGMSMINVADNGAAAIAKMREEQRQNGIITMQEAMAAEEYNDAMNSLKKSIQGLMAGALIPLMPKITETMRLWREWITANKELLREKIGVFFEELRDKLMKVVNAVIEFNKKYDIPKLIGKTLEVVGKLTNFLLEHGAVIAKVVIAVMLISATLQTFIAIMTVVNLVMLANPATWVVLGFMALIAAIAAAIIWWDDIKAAIVSFGDTVVDIFNGLPGPVEMAIGAVLMPIRLLIAAAMLVINNWDKVGTFFTNLWGGIKSTFSSAWDFISGIVDKVSSAVSAVTAGAQAAGRFLGIGPDAPPPSTGNRGRTRGGPVSGGTPKPVTQADTISKSLVERNTTNTLLIQDETGRAKMDGGGLLGAGGSIKLARSGGF